MKFMLLVHEISRPSDPPGEVFGADELVGAKVEVRALMEQPSDGAAQ